MCATGTIVAEMVLLKSSYPVHGRVSDRVLTSLPRVALVPSGPERSLPLAMIEAELRKDAPGRQALLDRLLDTLLITALRDWFDRSEAGAPAWYRAHGDPAVGHALKLIHTEPARPWTVASLAAEAGMSRARFALRFVELVGQPPMTYLTEWRLCRASDLIADTNATIEAIARQVGYSNACALSVAFKRASGIRPSEHRAAARHP
jgi:transcriptional regulator GlxA family with amidase domain